MSSVSDEQAATREESIQYYRAQAEHCRQQAERAVEAGIRQKWLDFADQWDCWRDKRRTGSWGKLR